MKVAVFGDSWAREIDDARSINTTPAWWSILSATYDLTNFGRSGSSTYYSYDLFEKAHADFDKIIFIASAPGRIHLPDELKLRSSCLGDLRNHQVTSLTDAESTVAFIKKYDPNAIHDINKLETIIAYYTSVMNLNEQGLINNMYQRMVKYTRGSEVLVIDSIPILYPISMFETTHWGIDLPTVFQQGYREYRKCHMSAENNVMMAREIDGWLKTGNFNLTQDKFVTPKDNWTSYFAIDRYLQLNAT